MPYAPGPAPMAMVPGYEFNESENATIASTARYARLWGIISVVAGILTLISGIGITALFAALPASALASSSASSPTAFKPAMLVAIGVSLIPSAIVNIVGGIFYMRAGGSLQSVVETQGNDIPLLMDSVRALSRAFMIEAIAMLVAFVIGLGIGVAMQMGAH